MSGKDDWKVLEQRVLVGCLQGKELVALDKNGSSDPFVMVKAELDKKKLKCVTKIVRRDLNPSWNQVFFIPGAPKYIECQVWDKDSVGKQFMGLATLTGITESVADVVTDAWYPLGPRPKDEKRGTTIAGQLRLTTIRCTAPASREALPADFSAMFWHKLFTNQFKTGDLILYSGTGIVDSALKAWTGSNFTNVAIVVKRPSRWSGEDEILLYEATGNESQSLDAWSDVKKSGVCCFKLPQRLFEFFGNGIFYCPLNVSQDALDDERVQSAIDWIQELHAKRPLTEYKEVKDSEKEESELTTPTLLLDPNFLGILSDLDMDIKKDAAPAFQIYSPQIAARFLQKMGAFPDEQVIQHHSININGLISMDAFKSQIFPLRSNLETASTFLKLCGAQKTCTEANGVKEQIGRVVSDFSAAGATSSSISRQQKQIDQFQQLIRSSSSTDPVPKLVASTFLGDDSSESEDALTDSESKKRSDVTQSPSKPKRQKKKGSKDSNDKSASSKSRTSKDSKS